MCGDQFCCGFERNFRFLNEFCLIAEISENDILAKSNLKGVRPNIPGAAFSNFEAQICIGWLIYLTSAWDNFIKVVEIEINLNPRQNRILKSLTLIRKSHLRSQTLKPTSPLDRSRSPLSKSYRISSIRLNSTQKFLRRNLRVTRYRTKPPRKLASALVPSLKTVC